MDQLKAWYDPLNTAPHATSHARRYGGGYCGEPISVMTEIHPYAEARLMDVPMVGMRYSSVRVRLIESKRTSKPTGKARATLSVFILQRGCSGQAASSPRTASTQKDSPPP